MLLFLAVWITNVVLHPVYVSMTNMDVDTQKGDIEVSIRIFTDDLETVLHNKYNVHSWIGTESEHVDSRRLLIQYVNERFKIVVNNSDEPVSLVTDSITIVGDMLWFNMSGSARQAIAAMEINNRLLTDFFPSQKNLMIVGTGENEREKGFNLDRRNYKVELSL